MSEDIEDRLDALEDRIEEVSRDTLTKADVRDVLKGLKISASLTKRSRGDYKIKLKLKHRKGYRDTITIDDTFDTT
jgi:hypothetical protein